jgi:hypothetical protein
MNIYIHQPCMDENLDECSLGFWGSWVSWALLYYVACWAHPLEKCQEMAMCHTHELYFLWILRELYQILQDKCFKLASNKL